MSLRQMLFAGWCLFVFAGSSLTSYYAWSPFADGRRPGSFGFYGPSHK